MYVLDKMGAICVQLEYHTVVARTCYEDLVSIARAEAVHSRSLAMALLDLYTISLSSTMPKKGILAKPLPVPRNPSSSEYWNHILHLDAWR